MRELYNKILQLLSSVEYEKIWAGFSRQEFALYDDTTVYFEKSTMPKDNHFLGNTAINYEGRTIAIWNVTEPEKEDADILASNLVHEMFHAFQMIHNEDRFPNDLIMLDEPDTIENFRLKRIENKLLHQAYLSKSLQQKKLLLTKFMATRKYRQSVVGDIIMQEYKSETIEGIAEYVGCMALKQLSTEKYEARLQDYLDRLTILGKSFLNHREMLYYTGAVFCITLQEAGIELYHEIGRESRTFFEIQSEGVQVKPLDENGADEELIILLKQHVSEKEKQFQKFLSIHTDKTEGNFIICGYDPMNMIKQGNLILCSRFIMLKHREQTEPQFIKGPVLLSLKEDTYNNVSWYMT